MLLTFFLYRKTSFRFQFLLYFYRQTWKCKQCHNMLGQTFETLYMTSHIVRDGILLKQIFFSFFLSVFFSVTFNLHSLLKCNNVLERFTNHIVTCVIESITNLPIYFHFLFMKATKKCILLKLLVIRVIQYV